MPRGCGDSRTQGGLYVAAGSPFKGLPLERFMQDPPVPWEGSEVLRSPQLIEDENGTNHLLMGIGKTNYPYVPDFLEETRSLGLSRKVPKDYNFSALEYGKSKLIIMHPRAIPKFSYDTIHFCPRKKKHNNSIQREKIENLVWKDEEFNHNCLGATYSFSMLDDGEQYYNMEDIWRGKKLPSKARYEHPIPNEPENGEELPWKAGIILIFPNFRFEFVDDQGRKPPKLKEKIQSQGFQFKVVPE